MSTQKHISAIKLTLAELLGMSTRAEWDVPYRRGLQEPERPQESPLPYNESLAKPVCIVGTTFVVALVGGGSSRLWGYPYSHLLSRAVRGGAGTGRTDALLAIPLRILVEHCNIL